MTNIEQRYFKSMKKIMAVALLSLQGVEERQPLLTTGDLAQAGQCFAGKIGTIFVENFFVGMELKLLPR